MCNISSHIMSFNYI
jgi:hypothetical protein